ncbi:hypothetical protein, unlikely [Trypanosoma congolense IL3000]|uniref:Uncharacterized protein n=1 Tax=Trypanosoma congolense (strain IL3000) TaxID=1068625 RepID=F9W6A5_TRYCI|nr:hypothetical protein, unlikely [Trypanosoma congolense IL3000]
MYACCVCVFVYTRFKRLTLRTLSEAAKKNALMRQAVAYRHGKPHRALVRMGVIETPRQRWGVLARIVNARRNPFVVVHNAVAGGAQKRPASAGAGTGTLSAAIWTRVHRALAAIERLVEHRIVVAHK